MDTLNAEDISKALDIINLIKERQHGMIKVRMCANGTKQKRQFKLVESVDSPTVSPEVIFTMLVIVRYEGEYITKFYVPAEYLHK